jgi:hypothetical protein
MAKKDTRIWWIVGGIIIILLLFSANRRERVGLGTYYIHNVTQNNVNYTYEISAAQDYTTLEGCLSQPTLGACDYWAVNNGTKDGCQLWTMHTSGYYNCDDEGYATNCEYGAVCDKTSVWGQRCNTHCQWYSDRVINHLYGGPKYGSGEGCAWYLRIWDKNNSLVADWSRMSEYPGWSQSAIHTTNSISNWTWRVDYPYGYESSATECYLIKFRIASDRWRYVGCIGTGGSDPTSPYCDEYLKYECIINCPAGTIRDSTTCTCQGVGCVVGETLGQCNGIIEKTEVLLNLTKWLRAEIATDKMIEIVRLYLKSL